VVVLYDDSSQNGFWKLAKVEAFIQGVDKQVRGAVICIPTREGRTFPLRRPVNQLCPLEINFTEESQDIRTPDSMQSWSMGGEGGRGCICHVCIM